MSTWKDRVVLPATPAAPSRFLRTHHVAMMLDLSPATLKKWRCQRVGPPFVKVGYHVRYEREALLAWINDLPHVVCDPKQPKQ